MEKRMGREDFDGVTDVLLEVLVDDDREKEFMLTDSCMWEAARIAGEKRTEHAIEVVEVKTGKTRYLASGSIIKFVEGKITKELSQEDYNNQDHENNN